jgi:TPP-dependent pyruvate/acetoin dehydrogenase alpha subunit
METARTFSVKSTRPSNEKLLEIYRLMKRCRAFEERSIEELRKGMPGFIHSAFGQEAIPCAISPFLREDDYILTTHRGHCDIIARGARFDRVMAELYAKETGYCRGLSGSMHITALDLNILGAVGIVGSGIPVASGVALACKMRNLDRIAVVYFGDGATCTGAFHEGVGFAAAFNLPVLFVLQNNQYEESTHWTYWGGRLKNLAERAKGYGIEGISVDGNDAVEVAQAAMEAIAKIRRGEGPILFEGRTYRIFGHHMGDPGTGYRSKEEVEEWRMKRDPIQRLYESLLEMKLLTPEENQALEASIARELDEAVRFALESPEIEPKEAFRDTVLLGWPVNLKKWASGDETCGK